MSYDSELLEDVSEGTESGLGDRGDQEEHGFFVSRHMNGDGDEGFCIRRRQYIDRHDRQ